MAVSYGFADTGTDILHSQLMNTYGLPFRVNSLSGDLVPSVVSTSDRTVRVGTGTAHAAGLLTVLTAAETASFAAATNATRYDALVLRHVWAPQIGYGVHTTTLVVVQGSAVPPVVGAAGTVSATQVNRSPGQVYDALIAIVGVRPGVGPFIASDIADVRTGHGIAGPASVPQENFSTYVDLPPGSALRVATTGRTFRFTTAGTVIQDRRGFDTREDVFTSTISGAMGAGSVAWPYPASQGGPFPGGTLYVTATDASDITNLGALFIKWDAANSDATRAAFRIYDRNGTALPNGTPVALVVRAVGN